MQRRARNAYVWALFIAFLTFGYGMILGLFKMFRNPTVWYGYDIPVGLMVVGIACLCISAWAIKNYQKWCRIMADYNLKHMRD
jgi:hypothetical protein